MPKINVHILLKWQLTRFIVRNCTGWPMFYLMSVIFVFIASCFLCVGFCERKFRCTRGYFET